MTIESQLDKIIDLLTTLVDSSDPPVDLPDPTPQPFDLTALCQAYAKQHGVLETRALYHSVQPGAKKLSELTDDAKDKLAAILSVPE